MECHASEEMRIDIFSIHFLVRDYKTQRVNGYLEIRHPSAGSPVFRAPNMRSPERAVCDFAGTSTGVPVLGIWQRYLGTGQNKEG